MTVVTGIRPLIRAMQPCDGCRRGSRNGSAEEATREREVGPGSTSAHPGHEHDPLPYAVPRIRPDRLLVPRVRTSTDANRLLLMLENQAAQAEARLTGGTPG